MEQQMATLRAAYANLNTIDPDGQGYAKLCELLDSLDTEALKTLACANIKFVSKLAINRFVRRAA
jgi:hypothetical protein